MPTALKKALSFEEQINFIKSIPVKIEDEQMARKYLFNISLCHLKTYWLSVPAAVTDKSFSEIVTLHKFDRKLKLIILEAISHIELSIRAVWIQCLTDEAKNCNALSYYKDQSLYCDSDKFQTLQRDMRNAIDKNGKHLPAMKKYFEKDTMPPIWKMSEIISLGLLSRLIAALNDTKHIAKHYYLEASNFKTILHIFSKIRNICAHHEILWNHTIKKYPKLHKSKKAALLTKAIPNTREQCLLYDIACFCAYFLTIIDKQNSQRWRKIFANHIIAAPLCAPQAEMGFSPDWQKISLWQ